MGVSTEEHFHSNPKTGSDHRGTPRDFIEKLERLLGLRFDSYDPCSLNPEGLRQQDGLGPAPAWVRCYFLNPPYSRKTLTNPGVEGWLTKVRDDQLNGVTVAVLLKLDWTTKWYKQLVLPYAQTIPVLGRIAFEGFDGGASFINFVAVYRPGIVPVLPVVIYP